MSTCKNGYISLLVLVFTLAPMKLQAHPQTLDTIQFIGAEITRNPDDVKLYLQRAELYRRHHNLRAALADLDCAERLGEPASELLVRRARIYADSNDFNRAYALYSQRLKAYPDDHVARIERAGLPTVDARQRVNDLEYVMNRYGASSADYYLWTARANDQVKPENCTAAARNLQNGINEHGALVTLISLGVELCERRGNPVRALEFIAQLSPTLRQTAKWQIRAGDLQDQAGHPNKARTHFEAAVAHINGLPDARQRTEAQQAFLRLARSRLRHLDNADAWSKKHPH